MKRLAALLLVLCLLLSACGDSSAETNTTESAPSETEAVQESAPEDNPAEESAEESPDETEASAGTEETAETPEETEPAESPPDESEFSSEDGTDESDTDPVPEEVEIEETPHYEPPEFAADVFDDSAAEGPENAQLDLSHTSEGYIGAKGSSSSRLKIQIIHGNDTYNYDLPRDGTPTFYPLQTGNGTYTIRILENAGGSQYVILYGTDTKVSLDDEFQPYLHPSYYVNYSEDSSCVEKAAELAAESTDQLDFISKVYDYVVSNVTYDYDLAATVTSGYVPDVEQIYADNTGICFDYSVLTAAMLRSQGVPTRVIFGYADGYIYHAWNMFYTEESGWITVSFKTKAGDWTRIDTTFAATGTDDEFIGNGSNYSATHVY